MSAACVWGWEFLGRGEQNTHLHKLAFQMGMLLMQDLTSTEWLLGGTLRPGHRVKVPARGWLSPASNSLFPPSCGAKLTAFIRGTAGGTKSLWSPAHTDFEDGQDGLTVPAFTLWPGSLLVLWSGGLALMLVSALGNALCLHCPLRPLRNPLQSCRWALAQQDTHGCPGRRQTPSQAHHCTLTPVVPFTAIPWGLPGSEQA